MSLYIKWKIRDDGSVKMTVTDDDKKVRMEFASLSIAWKNLQAYCKERGLNLPEDAAPLQPVASPSASFKKGDYVVVTADTEISRNGPGHTEKTKKKKSRQGQLVLTGTVGYVNWAEPGKKRIGVMFKLESSRSDKMWFVDLDKLKVISRDEFTRTPKSPLGV